MQAVDQVAAAAALPRPLARVLVGRGIDDAARAEAYLTPRLQSLPDPLALAGMAEAVERLAFALERGETIGIFGDYDVDGVTSTTLLWDFLEHLGARVVAAIPDRLVDGYGLSTSGVERLASAGAKLIVTVDCGVTAHEEVDFAKDRGLDVVVIDHHTVPVTLPRAVAVINPHRADCTRGSEALCAVGVTFNLCLALRRHLRERGFFSASCPEPDLKEALDLVALGTVADVVPLVAENRVLVAAGLGVLRQGKRLGLRALLEVTGNRGTIDAGTLGYHLGPRLNAAGRLGDAMQAVALLRAVDEGQARALAARLDRENASRRELERRIVAEAIRQVDESELLRDAPVVVVGDDAWHPGVVGIVASRLVERFGRPAVVVGEGGRGSGRSIERFHLHEGLCAVAAAADRGGLESFGGHAHAAGVRVATGQLSRFRDALLAVASARLSPDDLHRTVLHDGPLELAAVDVALCRSLERAAPFGRKNAEPSFLFQGLAPVGMRTLAGGHLKATVDGARGVELIAFGAAERAGALGRTVDVVATPEINEFRGAQTLQLRVKDLR
ncbi:MAG: single-stranded-DNA-specific exonuclease RecJ [Deltaproteobacteria bacterium]|nr:single-stranded-DNA-specific exonuclease RecJ [Deltaproteobacteria bacterium]